MVEDSSNGNHIVSLYGDPDGTMAEVPPPFEHPTESLEPFGVSVYVNANRLFIGTAGMDTTGSGNHGMGGLFQGLAP